MIGYVRIYYYRIVALILIISVSGCAVVSSPSTPYTKKEIIHIPYQLSNDRTGEVLIVLVDANTHTWSFVHTSSSPKTIREWQDIYPNHIMINGGYFQEDGTASGYLKIDDMRQDGNWFNYTTGGYLVIASNTFHIIPSYQQSDMRHAYAHVLESFPLLIHDTQVAIATDSAKYGRRTAMGVSVDGAMYSIIAPSGNISLYELATMLHTTEYEDMPTFDMVLNLDGGPSTGIIHPPSDTILYNYDRVPTIILGTPKQ
jgi:hypothetical protein